ncbi:TDT family transporter [Paracoccus xiamenensis]|uniref:SLAC1 family transporter n=1 Tax=Paracoccus xiamenensis TaxID=2714901 RepID=UPI00140E27CE|nr:tellurium resistance protein [Paracoccus xiamenensis]NHF71644.1 tellurium resistance protein [Paracoccus xiamenensis]
MAERLKFAMPKPAPAGLWRRVPPAIFPPILGLMALALAWRAGVAQFALPSGLSGMLDGVAVALFLFAATTYAVKLSWRPAVLADELATLPGRTGTAAGVLCVYLLAGLLSAYTLPLARAALLAGLALHLVLLVVVLRVLANGVGDARRVSPAWHLQWAGLLVAARVAPLLGWPGLAALLFWPGLLAALVIWAASMWQLRSMRLPAALRPLLAIHLAPLALSGTVLVLLGHLDAAKVIAVVVGLLLVAGLLATRWLTAAGFSALWGAFAFPVAASGGLFWTLYDAAPSEGLRIVAGLALTVATLVVVPITFLILRDWARGRLAVKTNAASA